MKIHSLFYYPVKSCAPVETDRLQLSDMGPLWDREWMLVDPDGKFVTQRQLPMLSQIYPKVGPESLGLSGFGSEVLVSLNTAKSKRKVQVWNDEVEALDEGEEVASWLEKQLRQPLRLVRFAGERKTGKAKDQSVRFPDSAPLHLCTMESLNELNSRLEAPVGILRFRPNIVLEGASAFAEDNWQGISINGWEFPITKACSRCSITTVEPSTGEKGVEPLKTLSTYRKRETKVEFGQYLLSVNGAELKKGMPVSPILR